MRYDFDVVKGREFVYSLPISAEIGWNYPAYLRSVAVEIEQPDWGREWEECQERSDNQNVTIMSDQENAPKPEDQGSSSGGDAGAEAKELLNKSLASFKKIDPSWQIYLVSLVVVLIGTLFFSAMSVEWKAEGAAAGIATMMGTETKHSSPSAFSADWRGKLAVLAALAGIGLFFWNRAAAKKEAWVPLALIGCAGVAALMLLLMWMSIDTPKSAGFSGVGGSVGFEVNMGLLGFWLPLIAAITATVVAVKQLLKA